MEEIGSAAILLDAVKRLEAEFREMTALCQGFLLRTNLLLLILFILGMVKAVTMKLIWLWHLTSY